MAVFFNSLLLVGISANLIGLQKLLLRRISLPLSILTLAAVGAVILLLDPANVFFSQILDRDFFRAGCG
jgi:hypothetical protein